jgi:hypothetical protein
MGIIQATGARQQMTIITDDQYQRIIEVATLRLRLDRMKDEDDEVIEQARRAFHAALSQVWDDCRSAVWVAATILDGRPCSMIDSSRGIQHCIVIAYKIGATVEDRASPHPSWGDLRAIMVNPPSQAKQ